MSETGIRLTIGTVLSIVWFVVLSGATDWPAVGVFIVAILAGFFLSVIDLILVAIFHSIDDIFSAW